MTVVKKPNQVHQPGRMVSTAVNQSLSVGSLTPKAMSLFFLILPKLSSYGKLNGDTYFIKGDVCPKVKWLTPTTIKACLKEINEKTDLKWFDDGRGGLWLHALNFEKYQKLRKDRMGTDHLPSFPGLMDRSRSGPGLLQLEGEGEGEGEDKGEGKEEGEGEDENRARISPIPSGLKLTGEMKEFAKSKGISIYKLEEEFQKYKDHYQSTGEGRADWEGATWRSWCNKAKKFGIEKHPLDGVKW